MSNHSPSKIQRFGFFPLVSKSGRCSNSGSRMARKLISMMDLPDSMSTMFTSRALLSAEDVVCKTEVDLMETLDVSLPNLSPALDRIQELVCPRHCSVLSLYETRKAREVGGGFLRTNLKELDDALHGGVPFGLITEIVGVNGVGKTQLCLMLSVLAALPSTADGLNSSVVYIDTEHKFSSKRMMEIAQHQFPNLCGKTEIMQQLAEHVLVLHPFSLSDLMKSLDKLEVMVIEHSVGLVIIDSIAALLQSDPEIDPAQQQEVLGKQASHLKQFLGKKGKGFSIGNNHQCAKMLAESFRIPIVVTNQVRAQSSDQGEETDYLSDPSHDVMNEVHPEEMAPGILDDGLTAALGMRWAHAANIRLLLDFSPSGWREITIIKSPLSALAIIPYCVTSKGLELCTAK